MFYFFSDLPNIKGPHAYFRLTQNNLFFDELTIDLIRGINYTYVLFQSHNVI